MEIPVGMIAPNGMHYVITFNGSYNDALVGFTQDQLNTFVLDYRKLEHNLTDFGLNGATYINSNGSISNLGVEKLFFETLKKMGLEGKVTLQRVDGNTVKSIKLDANNTPTPTTSC